MNEAAIEMFSTVGVAVLCIALGIMALAIFFKVMAWMTTSGSNPNTIAVRGILKKETWATVHMSNSKTF